MHHGHSWCIMSTCDASWVLILHHEHSWCIMSTCDASWVLILHHEYSWCIMSTHNASWALIMHHEYSWCIMRTHDASWVLMISWCIMSSHAAFILGGTVDHQGSVWRQLGPTRTILEVVHLQVTIQEIHKSWKLSFECFPWQLSTKSVESIRNRGPVTFQPSV